MNDHIDATLRECRMLLTMVRTPKLRRQLADLLSASDDRCDESTHTNAAPTIPEGSPLRRLSWVTDDGMIAIDRLAQEADDIKMLLSDDAILLMPPITAMPPRNEDRIALLRAVCTRVFDTTGVRNRLTEAEFNARLAMLVTDVATFRRYAVDYGVVRRSDDGAQYELA